MKNLAIIPTLVLLVAFPPCANATSQGTVSFRRASLDQFLLEPDADVRQQHGPPTWQAWLTSITMRAAEGIKASFGLGMILEEVSTVLDPPAAGKAKNSQAYFRAVSTTVQCVMALTIVSVMLYTLLSISRNVDELSGAFKPSTATRTLTAASRGAALAPMLCMLFVGCRMFVLATTEGLGEPPRWAKGCMYAATGGLVLQFFLVVLMSATAAPKPADDDDDEADYDMTEGKMAAAKAAKAAREAAAEAAAQATSQDSEVVSQAEEEHEDFDAATGEQNDAHPVLHKIKFKEGQGAMKPVFYAGQVLSITAIYGGVLGVLTCIATFPAQTTQVSPAVKCTCFLTILYFTAYLLLWVSREMPASESSKKLLHAALSMTSVVRKAPQFAVLFLVSRMRALELDPPYGMPPRWMQLCFYTITLLMYLESIAAFFVGYTGRKAKAYYGVYVFHCQGTAGHIVQHACAMITYLALYPIAIGAIAMPDQNGQPAPLSTTFKVTLLLTIVYFGIAFGQTLVFFIEDLAKCEMTLLQDTFVSAGVSVSFAPLICILCVATRMRALQITQQKGDPPGWAQDCMLICVFGTCVQAVCCLVMPIFVGSASQVDDDGNPDYDLRPMVLAYAVTCVKYVALMFLHGGIFMICAAVFLMTPETAHSGGRFMTGGKALFRALGGVLLVFLLAMLFSSAKVIGMAVKIAIESCDRIFLGVDITIKHAALGVCKGYVAIKDLVLHQPEGELIYERDEDGIEVARPSLKWDKDYILKIKTVIVKINLWRLITTAGKEFELENLSFTGIHANIEKPSANPKLKDSNIDYLLNHIESLGLAPPPEEEPADDDADDTADDNAVAQKKAEEEEARRQEEAEAKKKAEEEAKKAEEEAKTAEEEAKKGAEAPPPAAGDDFVPKIILRKIAFGDIGCGVTIKQVPIIGTLSFHPGIGLVEFEDIQRDIFDNREDLAPPEVVACIVKALAKKIATVVVSDIPKQLGRTSKEMARKVAAKGMDGMKKMGQTLRRACQRGQTPGTSEPVTPSCSDAEPSSPAAVSAPEEAK